MDNLTKNNIDTISNSLSEIKLDLKKSSTDLHEIKSDLKLFRYEINELKDFNDKIDRQLNDERDGIEARLKEIQSFNKIAKLGIGSLITVSTSSIAIFIGLVIKSYFFN